MPALRACTTMRITTRIEGRDFGHLAIGRFGMQVGVRLARIKYVAAAKLRGRFDSRLPASNREFAPHNLAI